MKDEKKLGKANKKYNFFFFLNKKEKKKNYKKDPQWVVDLSWITTF
jgi:hypothetical protein